jgi:hypothetical protein
MRITIEIDEKSGTVSAESGAALTGVAPPGWGATPPAAASVAGPPPDVLALAAATGAINAGPAPTFLGPSDSAPHPFISQGGRLSSTSPSAAISAGPAAQGKPCA